MPLFELHISTKDLLENQIQGFELFCESIEAKPILIELSEGQFYRQPMISKVINCENKEALEREVSLVYEAFNTANFPVVRVKIEVPFWDKKRTENYYSNSEENYFEWHGKIIFSKPKRLAEICKKYEGHLSKNSLKKDPDKKFITLRDYGEEVSIQKRIEGLKKELQKQKIQLIKEELEYCIFDSNVQLDKGWIN